jgi:parvulin-like peptidyl-prolyl isomerase
MIRTNKYLIIPVVVLCLIVVQCGQSKNEKVIARVGKSTLSLENLKNSIPNEYSDQITRDQNINYVKQWIDRELLFQEAVNQKIDKDPAIKERLIKMKMDLLAAEMLNRYSMKIQADSISDSVVNHYYKINQNQFIREKDYVKYLDIAIDDSKKAWELYRTVTKENFVNFASQFSKAPTFDSINIPYTSVENIPVEIRQAIASTVVNTISTPIKTSNGYHIINVMDKLDKGGICSLFEVRKEIIDQLVTINQKVLIEKVLADLRAKNRVDFNLNLISDSLKNKSFN